MKIVQKHTFTKRLKRPYDDVFHYVMNETVKYLCENIVSAFVSGFEIIGNIYDNPELLEDKK